MKAAGQKVRTVFRVPTSATKACASDREHRKPVASLSPGIAGILTPDSGCAIVPPVAFQYPFAMPGQMGLAWHVE